MTAGIIIGTFIGGALGVVVTALLQIAKQTAFSDGVEPSLEQEDRFVFLENAEKMKDEQEE